MIALDVHAHLAPINHQRLSEIKGVEWLQDERVLVVDGHRIAMRDLFDAQRLVAWMDKYNVQRALVSIPPPLYRQHLAVDAALTWAGYVNDELRSLCALSAGRLGALCHLPMEHPDVLADLAEQNWQSGSEGFAIAAGGDTGVLYSDARFEPLWERLNAYSSFVFMHPAKCCDERLGPYYLENLVGNPIETGVAAAHLIMKGVPARFPNIRFCLAHAGGILPTLVGRLQRGFDTKRPGVDLTVESPQQAARRFFADCIAHNAAALDLTKKILGDSHVLFGSDWPFPMGIDAPITGS